jgi:hypothetical protein
MTKLLTTDIFSITTTIIDSLTKGLTWTATDYIHLNARPTLTKHFRQGKMYCPNPCLSPNIIYTKRIHFTINFMHGPEERVRYSDSLRSRRSGDQIPMGARFSALVLIGPGVHPAFYTIGTGSFLWLKRPASDDNPLPSSTEFKERV